MDKITGYLEDVMGWTEYEASAYITLVKEGPLNVSEIEARSKVSSGKGYDTIGRLEEKEVVVKKPVSPQQYDAVEPRQIIQTKEDEFENKASEIKQRLGTAYEMNVETRSTQNEVWMSEGRSGFVKKIREAIDRAEDSIFLCLWDSRWIEPTDLRELSNKIAAGVDVQIVCFDGRPNIGMIAEEGIPVWKSPQIDTMYGIIDQSKLTLEIRQGNISIGFVDEFLARVFTRDFQLKIETAEKVDSDA